MEKQVEQKDSLFIKVSDINRNWYVLNKRHIVSVTGSLRKGGVTTISMSNGLNIDTQEDVSIIRSLLLAVRHDNER